MFVARSVILVELHNTVCIPLQKNGISFSKRLFFCHVFSTDGTQKRSGDHFLLWQLVWGVFHRCRGMRVMCARVLTASITTCSALQHRAIDLLARASQKLNRSDPAQWPQPCVST